MNTVMVLGFCVVPVCLSAMYMLMRSSAAVQHLTNFRVNFNFLRVVYNIKPFTNAGRKLKNALQLKYNSYTVKLMAYITYLGIVIVHMLEYYWL